MQEYEFEEETHRSPPKRNEGKIRHLARKYAGLIKAGKFAAGSAIGFLDTEIILVLGSYFLYGKLNPPQSASFSPNFWALNAVAFGIGVTVAFFVNEMFFLHDERYSREQFGLWKVVEKLVKFQLIFLTGNVIIVIVQLLLLKEFSIPPYFGNIIGAIVSFPASYFFSMFFVWAPNDVQKEYAKHESGFVAEPRKIKNEGIAEAERVLRRFPAFSNEDYKVNINEYRLDLIPRKENETLIDFALSLEVILQESKI
jgi:putative flippase GtrA